MIGLEKAKKIIGKAAYQNLSNEELTKLVEYFYILARIKANHTKIYSDEESSNNESGKQRRTG